MKKYILLLIFVLIFPTLSFADDIPWGHRKTVKVSENDATAGYLNGKLVAGTGVTFSEGNDGASETLTINATGSSNAFLDLTDVPASYSGQSGKYTRVNATEDGLEFGTPAGSGDMTKAEYDIADNGVVDDAENVTCSGCVADAEIASTFLKTVDISANTNLAAGRSLTLSGDSVEADAELYTDEKTIYIENPTANDDLKTIWVAPSAITISSISCESDQTVNFDLQVDDGTATGVNGSDIACTTFATDSTLAGDTTMAAGDRLDLAVASVSGTPTWVSISWEYTKDD